jgi:hypothetical protein
LPNGHLHRSDNHVAILSVMHRPANDQLAEQVENHAQEQLSFFRGYLRNIGHPLGVWLQSREIPLQMIPDTRWPIRSTPQTTALLAWPSLNAMHGHQSRHTIQAR